ncbi:MAG TPA: phosphoribosyltransferase [Bryobacteraceae bacterium]|nr:phosphoribosyltransferase [Bryobacteraceae bacterium]
MRFRQSLEPVAGEKVVLVDDLLCSGMLLTEARQLLEARGAQVVALAVLVYQPTPQTRAFGSLPLYYLAKLDATYYADASACQFCRRHVPLHRVSMVRHVQEDGELVGPESFEIPKSNSIPRPIVSNWPRPARHLETTQETS